MQCEEVALKQGKLAQKWKKAAPKKGNRAPKLKEVVLKATSPAPQRMKAAPKKWNFALKSHHPPKSAQKLDFFSL